jgi:hypothetical protein
MLQEGAAGGEEEEYKLRALLLRQSARLVKRVSGKFTSDIPFIFLQ